MQTEPYSIYVNHRPCRIAYLLDRSEGAERFDKIIALNRKMWGGRYNPIVLTERGELSQEWWRFLRAYDPDFLKTAGPLKPGLASRIQSFLSPLDVDESEEVDSPFMGHEPLRIAPTPELISATRRGLSDGPTALVAFELAPEVPESVGQFVRRNFGSVPTVAESLYYETRAMREVTLQSYRVDSLASLNDALLDLGQFRRVVFPAQLCSIPQSPLELGPRRARAHFAVIVGDAIDDLTLYWNAIHNTPSYLRTSFTHLWLPVELAKEPALRGGLAKLLNRYVTTVGDQAHGAQFLSCSLEEPAIQDVVSQIGESKWYWTSVHRVPAAPPVEDRPSERGGLVPLTRSLELHRAHSTEEHLPLAEAAERFPVVAGDCWFADVYVQLRPERFHNIHGAQYWWRLPIRNSVLEDSGFFSLPARVRADGYFSVLLTRRAMSITDSKTLVVRIPRDETIAWSLMCGDQSDRHKLADSLATPTSNERFDDIQQSDKGQILSGVLGFFPDLLNAYRTFEERFWRRTFEEMSNQSSRKDEAKRAVIARSLAKRTETLNDAGRLAANLEWLAQLVVDTAKDYSREPVQRTLAELENAAQAETTEYNKAHPTNPIPFNATEFKDRVATLLEWKVLLTGLRPKCPRCAFRIWYHIDELRQQVACKGCGYEFTIEPDIQWTYQLNSLIRAAVSLHGTVPVLLVLGQLMREARTSFLYLPPTVLVKRDAKTGVERHDAELDVVCIQDGRFVIGEVKQSSRRFSRREFETAARVAKQVRPNRVIFSSLEGEPTGLVRSGIEWLRTELASFEVEVEWYEPRPWIQEAQPVR